MRIGEVITENNEDYVVVSVVWVGKEYIGKEPITTGGYKVRPNYTSKIGEVGAGSVIVGEIINEDNEIEYVLGDESNFDPNNIDDPLLTYDFTTVGEKDLY